MNRNFEISLSSVPSAFHVQPLDVPRADAAGVELLCVTLDFGLNLNEPAFAVLSDDEFARAAGFVRHEDAIRFATTRVVLRNVLAHCAGLTPSELRLKRGAAGRPFLVLPNGHMGASVDFNVSHSGQYALIAFATGRRVGVDIEARRADVDWRALSATVLSAQDEACVAALPEHLCLNAFYDVWTAKEALLKALGVGIGRGMTWFSVLGGTQHELHLRVTNKEAHLGRELTRFDAALCLAAAGYSACVAWSRYRLVGSHNFAVGEVLYTADRMEGNGNSSKCVGPY